MVALFIKSLKKTNWIKYTFYASAVSLLMSPAFTNPVIPLLQITFLFFVVLLYSVPKRPNRSLLAIKFFVFISLWFLINAYWIFPLIPLASTFIGSPYRMYSPDIIAFRDHSVPLVDALRITGPNGYWTLNQKVSGDPIIPWANIYSSPILVLLSFLMPIAAFLPIILRPRDKGVILFSTVAIVSILFVTGSNPPFGSILEQILFRTNLIGLFREPFAKFGYFLALSYSYLWAICLSVILEGKNET